MPTDQDLALRKLVVRVAGVVAAGIGVLGFVAVVGGASYWWRFSSIGLPADEAVADLTHSQLLVLGVRELFPFLAVLAVEPVVLYLLEGAVTGDVTVGPFGRLSRHAAANHTPAPEAWVKYVRAGTTVLAVVIAVIDDAIRAPRRSVPSLLVILAIALLLAIIILLYAGDAKVPLQRFVLAVMGATAVFGMCSGASVIAEAPPVRPVVIVTDDGRALAGLYVSASADEVYVGEVCAKLGQADIGDNSTGSLLDIPRGKVALMLVGNNGSLDQAISREDSLLSHLPELSDVDTVIANAVPPPATQTGGRRCTDASAASGVGS